MYLNTKGLDLSTHNGNGLTLTWDVFKSIYGTNK